MREPITTPTLAVGAEHVFGAAVGDNLRTAAADLQTAVLDGCGHYVSEERPRELARLLLTFFGAHAGSQRGRAASAAMGDSGSDDRPDTRTP